MSTRQSDLAMEPPRTVDEAEVARFARMADEWWDASGKFKPLHAIGPARLEFIRDEICRHFRREARMSRPLEGLSALDVGCGGGLICEPLTRMGAKVIGIDLASESIAVAKAHAAGQGLDIDYRVERIETLAAASRQFDIVTCLEVVEHVPDVSSFISSVAETVRPGGILLMSTINRTMKSFALAIVGAEYVLRWLPRGTHQWNRFVTPEELEKNVSRAGLSGMRFRGISYSPLADRWSLADDIEINYLASARKPAAQV